MGSYQLSIQFHGQKESSTVDISQSRGSSTPTPEDLDSKCGEVHPLLVDEIKRQALRFWALGHCYCVKQFSGLGVHCQGSSAQGRDSHTSSFNILELKTTFQGLMVFKHLPLGQNVKLKMNNSNAVHLETGWYSKSGVSEGGREDLIVGKAACILGPKNVGGRTLSADSFCIGNIRV